MTGLTRDAKHFYSWNGGPKVPGITTVIGVMDKPALVGWAKRETAVAALRNWRVIEGMVKQQPVVEESITYHPAVAYLKAMPGYQKDAAADVGTRVHAIAEAMTKGEKPEVAEDVLPFAEAYIRDFLERYKPKTAPLYVEAMVYHEGNDLVMPYGGTMDLICRIDDDIWAIDHKTSKSGVFAETALQLAAGRFAQFIGRPGDPEQYAMPNVTRYGVLWIRPEGAQLVEYKVTPAEFQAFTACRLLWHWVNVRSKNVKEER